MSHPTFCSERYAAYDNIGRVAAKHFFEQIGYTFVPETEQYGAYDLTMQSPHGEFVHIEVEVTKAWTGRCFPYSYMSVPTRKSTSKADMFVKVNVSGNSILVCPMNRIKSAPIIRKDTTLSRNEPFYNVDVATISSYYLEDGEWYTDDDESITP